MAAHGGASVIVAAPGFVGRQRELATVATALASAPAFVLVEGEAGVGKSRLVQEFFASQPGLERTTLLAFCPPFHLALTLGPIVDALQQACGDPSRLALSPLAGALRTLFPEWSEHLPAALEPLDDPAASRLRVFRALSELIDRLGVRLLVVEDLHWADEVTIEFLAFLACRPKYQRLGLLLTARPEDIPAGSPLRRLTGRSAVGSSQARIQLQPLDMAHTADLVSSMLAGAAVSAAFAEFVYERTDGLPLAVQETVRLLADRGDLAWRGGTWVRHHLEDTPVPPTVRDLVLARQQRLSDDAQLVLRAMAVLASPVSEDIVAEVAELSRAETRRGWAEGVASGLLIEHDRSQATFRHAIMGDAVSEAMPLTLRRRLHARAGETLERLDPRSLTRLVRHFREAGDVARWAKYVERAADLAARRDHHTAAVNLLLELLAEPSLPLTDQIRLAQLLAVSSWRRHEPIDDLHQQVLTRLRALVERAELSDEQKAELRAATGHLLIGLRQHGAGTEELTAAASRLNHNPVEAVRAMVYLGKPLCADGTAETHSQWLERAEAVLDGVELDLADQLSILSGRATAWLMLGEGRGWTAVADLPRDWSNATERQGLARALSNVGFAAVIWGRYAEASQHLAKALELTESNRIRGDNLASTCLLDWYTGHWTGLHERASHVAHAEAFDACARLEGLLVCGLVDVARAPRRATADGLLRIWKQAQGNGELTDALTAAAYAARIHLQQGRVAEAVAISGEAMDLLIRKGIWLWATDITPVRVEALLAAGEASEAEVLVSALDDGLGGIEAPAPRAALAACRAALAAHEAQDLGAELYARAAAAWEELPRPYDALLARERLAMCLIRLGERDAAIRVLIGLYEELCELGARADADRVGSILRGEGVVVRRKGKRGRRGYGDKISPSELDVVRLVVTGRSNREIAEALNRSPSTVSAQLQSALRKFAVSSRTALAVRAVESGLVTERETAAAREMTYVQID